jgi:serine/threonine protein kinase
MKEIQNEKCILNKLHHPGVIQLHKSFTEQNNLCLVVDYAINGDFSTFLHQKSLKTFDVKLYYTV